MEYTYSSLSQKNRKSRQGGGTRRTSPTRGGGDVLHSPASALLPSQDDDDENSEIDEEMERTKEAMSELQRQLAELEDRRGSLSLRRPVAHVSFGASPLNDSLSTNNPGMDNASVNLHEVVHLRHLSQVTFIYFSRESMTQYSTFLILN